MSAMWEFFLHKVMRISGWVALPGILFTALSTGQAEVSYKFWLFGTAAYFVAIFVARLEA